MRSPRSTWRLCSTGVRSASLAVRAISIAVPWTSSPSTSVGGVTPPRDGLLDGRDRDVVAIAQDAVQRVEPRFVGDAGQPAGGEDDPLGEPRGAADRPGPVDPQHRRAGGGAQGPRLGRGGRGESAGQDRDLAAQALAAQLVVGVEQPVELALDAAVGEEDAAVASHVAHHDATLLEHLHGDPQARSCDTEVLRQSALGADALSGSQVESSAQLVETFGERVRVVLVPGQRHDRGRPWCCHALPCCYNLTLQANSLKRQAI